MAEHPTSQKETASVCIKLAQVESQVLAYLKAGTHQLTVIYNEEEHLLSYDPGNELMVLTRGRNQMLVHTNRAHAVELTQEAIKALKLDTSPFVQEESQPVEADAQEDPQILVPVESKIAEIGQYLRMEPGVLTASYGEHTGLPLRVGPDRGHVQVGIPTGGGGTSWTLVQGRKGISLEPESVTLIDAFSHSVELSFAARSSRIFTDIGGRAVQVSTVAEDPKVPIVAAESLELPSILNIPAIKRELLILEEELDGLAGYPIEHPDRLRLFTEFEDAGYTLKCIFDELAGHGFTILQNSPHSTSANMLIYGDHKGQVYRLIERIIKMMKGRRKFSRFLCKCPAGSRLCLLLEIDKGNPGDSLDSVDTASIIAA